MKIQLVNHLGSEHDADLQRLAEVCNTYAMLVCGTYELQVVQVQFKAGADVPDVGWYELGAFANPDVAGALGYHDLDPKGQPYGKAFLSIVPGRVMLHDPSGHGASLAGVITHELAEMIGDRYANMWAFGDIKDPLTPDIYGAVAYELADPVQDGAFVIQSSDGTAIDCSDFVLPCWFNPDTPVDCPSSYMGQVKGPFACAHGGYLIVADQNGDKDVFAATHNVPAWRTEIRELASSRKNRRGH